MNYLFNVMLENREKIIQKFINKSSKSLIKYIKKMVKQGLEVDEVPIHELNISLKDIKKLVDDTDMVFQAISNVAEKYYCFDVSVEFYNKEAFISTTYNFETTIFRITIKNE